MIKANQSFNVQVSQSVENLLKPIDKLIIKEIMVDDNINEFFVEQNSSYNIYQTYRTLNNMISTYPIIDSMYLYRQSDQMVLTNNMYTNANQFVDRDFILIGYFASLSIIQQLLMKLWFLSMDLVQHLLRMKNSQGFSIDRKTEQFHLGMLRFPLCTSISRSIFSTLSTTDNYA